MKHDETKRAIAQARRKQLSDLSNKLKTANLLILRDVSITINDLLVKYYEKQAGRPLELNEISESGYSRDGLSVSISNSRLILEFIAMLRDKVSDKISEIETELIK